MSGPRVLTKQTGSDLGQRMLAAALRRLHWGIESGSQELVVRDSLFPTPQPVPLGPQTPVQRGKGVCISPAPSFLLSQGLCHLRTPWSPSGWVMEQTQGRGQSGCVLPASLPLKPLEHTHPLPSTLLLCLLFQPILISNVFIRNNSFWE